MKTVVYTSILNNYDTLRRCNPQRDTSIDFICFTDNLDIEPNGWQLRPIPEDLKGIPQNKIQRLIKICPHRYLKEYDVSLWIDGNITITCELSEFITPYLKQPYFFFTRRHPTRKCIYQEAKAIVKIKRDVVTNVKPQIDKYIQEGFPRNFGLVESNVILRRHNEPKCMLLDNLWAREILTGSHRDQLSFNYCLWKLKYRIGYLDLPNLLKNDKFEWHRHG